MFYFQYVHIAKNKIDSVIRFLDSTMSKEIATYKIKHYNDSWRDKHLEARMEDNDHIK